MDRIRRLFSPVPWTQLGTASGDWHLPAGRGIRRIKLRSRSVCSSQPLFGASNLPITSLVLSTFTARLESADLSPPCEYGDLCTIPPRIVGHSSFDLSKPALAVSLAAIAFQRLGAESDTIGGVSPDTTPTSALPRKGAG